MNVNQTLSLFISAAFLILGTFFLAKTPGTQHWLAKRYLFSEKIEKKEQEEIVRKVSVVFILLSILLFIFGFLKPTI